MMFPEKVGKMVNPFRIITSVVLKVARMMIERDCNILSKSSKPTFEMLISPKAGIESAEWNKRVDCVRLIAFYQSDTKDSPESEGDYGEEVVALTAKYIELVEKRIIRSLVGLAYPAEAEDEDG